MPEPSMCYIEQLSTSELSKLARLLILPPNASPNWLQTQADAISRLPSILLKPKGLIARIARHAPGAPDRGTRCETHRPLNPHLIRLLFILLTSEVTTNIQRLADKTPSLPPTLLAFVRRMHSINSLWMSPSLFHTVYKQPVQHQRVPGYCEACILAIIGGNEEMLVDLMASVRGRRRRGQRHSRLRRLLTAWFDASSDPDKLENEAKNLGKEIMTLREDLRKKRRRNSLEIAIEQPKSTSKPTRPPRPNTAQPAPNTANNPFSDRYAVPSPRTPRNESLPDPYIALGLRPKPSTSTNFFHPAPPPPQPTPTNNDEDEEWTDDSVHTPPEIEPAINEEEENADVENSVIDHYTRLLSNPNLPQSVSYPQESDIHPLYRASIISFSSPLNSSTSTRDRVFRPSFSFNTSSQGNNRHDSIVSGIAPDMVSSSNRNTDRTRPQPPASSYQTSREGSRRPERRHSPPPATMENYIHNLRRPTPNNPFSSRQQRVRENLASGSNRPPITPPANKSERERREAEGQAAEERLRARGFGRER